MPKIEFKKGIETMLKNRGSLEDKVSVKVLRIKDVWCDMNYC